MSSVKQEPANNASLNHPGGTNAKKNFYNYVDSSW